MLNIRNTPCRTHTHTHIHLITLPSESCSKAEKKAILFFCFWRVPFSFLHPSFQSTFHIREHKLATFFLARRVCGIVAAFVSLSFKFGFYMCLFGCEHRAVLMWFIYYYITHYFISWAERQGSERRSCVLSIKCY